MNRYIAAALAAAAILVAGCGSSSSTTTKTSKPEVSIGKVQTAFLERSLRVAGNVSTGSIGSRITSVHCSKLSSGHALCIQDYILHSVVGGIPDSKQSDGYRVTYDKRTGALETINGLGSR